MAQQHFLQVKDKEARPLAFLELQGKMQELGRALRQIAFRLQLIEKEQRRCKITLQELGSMPVSTPMYKAAGRTFIFTSGTEVNKDFESRLTKLASEQVGLENQGKFYQKQFDEAEKQLKELIVQG